MRCSCHKASKIRPLSEFHVFSKNSSIDHFFSIGRLDYPQMFIEVAPCRYVFIGGYDEIEVFILHLFLSMQLAIAGKR